jgi:uncharacterized GH25 family protein
MIRSLSAVVLALGCCGIASAHFVFVLPDKDGAKATVVFSDGLEEDENVPIAKIASLALTCRDAEGKNVAVKCEAAKHSLTAKLPGTGPRVVFGSVTYGVMAKGDKPYLLVYHPKVIIGALGDRALLGKDATTELVPVVSGGKTRLKLLGAGKPVADAEVNLLTADGGTSKLKTDKDGLTGAIGGAGRFGAWARFFETREGEHGGMKYSEVRNYATLVFDVAK